MTRGKIRFDHFMGMALHDPERGYYARRIGWIRRRGDFTTAPMLSGCSARVVAAWAAGALRETGCRDLIEIGPGDGTLAECVWRMLPWSLRWRTRLHLVGNLRAAAGTPTEAVGPARALARGTARGAGRLAARQWCFPTNWWTRFRCGGFNSRAMAGGNWRSRSTRPRRRARFCWIPSVATLVGVFAGLSGGPVGGGA